MAEVTRQLAPLEAKIDRTHFAVERLFNTNGGPPGYLQTARKEDNDRFDMIFNILEEHKQDIQPIKDFIRDHEFLETVRAKQFKRYIAIWSLIVAVVMALITLIDHKDAILHSLETPPAVHSQLEQSSTIPAWRQ